jgi:pyruvate formate lyase activating enzyme
MNSLTGYFMEPQNFSLNDGNGIRTIIFFAGCPLKCKWCSNPESYTNTNKIVYNENRCIKCGRCAKVCSYGVGINLNNPIERKLCKSCGLCVKVCLTNSRKNLIYHYNSEEILKIIEKQEIFYRLSGGGVTFSGGEATLQADMLRELVYKLYDKAIDLAIETSGNINFEEMIDILEKLNLIFIDIKHMDNNKHISYTGVGNEKILKNITRLNELKVPVVVRIPVIDGVNSHIENIRKTAEFVKANIDVPKVELLPFHSFGENKYEEIGLKNTSSQFKTPSQQYLRELSKIIENEGVEVVSYK